MYKTPVAQKKEIAFAKEQNVRMAKLLADLAIKATQLAQGAK